MKITPLPARIGITALWMWGIVGRGRGARFDVPRAQSEAEVVARREGGEPVIADADLAPHLLVDHRVEHRVGLLQACEVGDRGHPSVEPAVALAAKRLVDHGPGNLDIVLASLQAI